MNSFMPHGFCLHWDAPLLFSLIFGNAFIALAYFSIPASLYFFIRKRKDLPYPWVFKLFGAFILACGLTHVMNTVTIYWPNYWLEAGIVDVAAVISVVTAILLWPLLPKALALRSPRELEEANNKLVAEITERQIAEESLKELMQQREDFVATLTHDLKTPIIAANRAINLLIDGDFGPVPANQIELLRTMADSNSAMYQLVRTLLDVYRYESGAHQLALKACPLQNIIAAVVKTMEPLAHSSGITCSIVLPDTLTDVTCDEEEIRRVLENLLSNAIKYTDSGGNVTIKMDQSANETTLSIRDTGIGITSEEQKTIFKRFAQVQPTGKVPASTGLGLYLTRKIIESHGGTIFMESEIHKGSTFTFKLPHQRELSSNP